MPTGLADLQAAMAAQQLNYPGDPYLVEGYSQSAAIAISEKGWCCSTDAGCATG